MDAGSLSQWGSSTEPQNTDGDTGDHFLSSPKEMPRREFTTRNGCFRAAGLRLYGHRNHLEALKQIAGLIPRGSDSVGLGRGR